MGNWVAVKTKISSTSVDKIKADKGIMTLAFKKKLQFPPKMGQIRQK
jgi:hypothetical protein